MPGPSRPGWHAFRLAPGGGHGLRNAPQAGVDPVPGRLALDACQLHGVQEVGGDVTDVAVVVLHEQRAPRGAVPHDARDLDLDPVAPDLSGHGVVHGSSYDSRGRMAVRSPTPADGSRVP